MPSAGSGLFSELKRRNVFRVAAMYAVAAWLFDWTTEGLIRTPDDPETEVVRLRSSRRIDFAIVGILVLALGTLLCKSGAADEGIPLLEEARRISADDPLIAGDLGWCLATLGRTDDARALLAELEERTALEWVSPVALARVYIGLGDNDKALAELERALAERAYRVVMMDVEARWDPLRARPRFEALRRAVGLSEQRSLTGIQ